MVDFLSVEMMEEGKHVSIFTNLFILLVLNSKHHSYRNTFQLEQVEIMYIHLIEQLNEHPFFIFMIQLSTVNC